MKGHLGLKSSPFNPTSSKLTSQYMVVDHMAAHYRKINAAKSAIDMKEPKAWSVSQKMRDQARREALKHESKKRREALRSNHASPAKDTGRDSDVDRLELFEMMHSITEEDGTDAINTTLEVHPSDNLNMTREQQQLVDQLVRDNQSSPSKYHSPRPVRSNIPPSMSKRMSSKQLMMHTQGARTGFGQQGTMTLPQEGRGISPRTTPRQDNADLLNTRAHKFTDEKDFTPRTLKTHSHVQSKLSSLKCYKAPKKKQSKGEPGQRSTLQARPETPMTAMSNLTTSVDLMNETLMSRDLSKGSARTPTGIPPLDISMDADHMNWLKEQSKKAQFRAGHSVESCDPSSMSHMNGEYLSRTQTLGRQSTWHRAPNDGYPMSPTLKRVHKEEEELKYLEFVQDVTNDILETGVFTNKTLKRVFQRHIDKRKHELKISRMRELIEELRADLGIPPGDYNENYETGFESTIGYDTLGDTLNSTGAYQEEEHITDKVQSLSLNDVQDGKHSRSKTFNPMMTTQKFDMSQIRGHPENKDPSFGKPPLPRPRARGATHSVSIEEPEETIAEDVPLSPNGSAGYSVDFSDDEQVESASNVALSLPRPSPRKPKTGLSPRPEVEEEEEKEPSSIQVSELDEYDPTDDF